MDSVLSTINLVLCQALCLLTSASGLSAANRLTLFTTSDSRVPRNLWRDIQAEVTKLVIPGFSEVHMESRAPAVAVPDFLVSVHLTGRCDTNNVSRDDSSQALGYVILTDGVIAPSIWVNCDAILRTLNPLHNQTVFSKNLNLARAIARVIEHELRHILEQTADHLPRGVFKSHLGVNDLTSEPPIFP